MDVEKILGKRIESEARYKALQERQASLQGELGDIGTELTKLQGEYRAYEALIKDYSAKGAEEVTDAE